MANEILIGIDVDSTDVRKAAADLAKLDKTVATAGQATKKMGQEASKSGRLLDAYGRAVRDTAAGSGALTRSQMDMQKELAETQSELASVRDELKRIEESMKRTGNETQEVTAEFDAFSKVLRRIGPLVAVAIAAFGISKLQSTTMQLTKIKMTFESVTGSAAGAAKEMQYVTEAADRLGQEVLVAAGAYAKMLAAADAANIPLQDTRNIFEGVSAAGTAFGLTAYEVEGALLAVQQIISKGSVQAEELRGQLGERLPGAFAIAAQAMDMTVSELSKNLELGAVSADEFVTKFGAELQERFGGFAESAETAGRAVNEIENAMLSLQEQVINGGFRDALFTVLESLTGLATSDAAVAGAKALGAAFNVAAKAAGALFDVLQKVLDSALVSGPLKVMAGALEIAANNMDAVAVAAGGLAIALASVKFGSIGAAAVALIGYLGKLRIVMAALQVQTLFTAKAFRALTAAMMANPFTAAAVGITTLAGALMTLKENTPDLDEALQKAKEASDKLVSTVFKLEGQVGTLLESYQTLWAAQAAQDPVAEARATAEIANTEVQIQKVQDLIETERTLARTRLAIAEQAREQAQRQMQMSYQIDARKGTGFLGRGDTLLEQMGLKDGELSRRAAQAGTKVGVELMKAIQDAVIGGKIPVTEEIAEMMEDYAAFQEATGFIETTTAAVAEMDAQLLDLVNRRQAMQDTAAGFESMDEAAQAARTGIYKFVEASKEASEAAKTHAETEKERKKALKELNDYIESSTKMFEGAADRIAGEEAIGEAFGEGLTEAMRAVETFSAGVERLIGGAIKDAGGAATEEMQDLKAAFDDLENAKGIDDQYEAMRRIEAITSTLGEDFNVLRLSAGDVSEALKAAGGETALFASTVAGVTEGLGLSSVQADALREALEAIASGGTTTEINENVSDLHDLLQDAGLRGEDLDAAMEDVLAVMLTIQGVNISGPIWDAVGAAGTLGERLLAAFELSRTLAAEKALYDATDGGPDAARTADAIAAAGAEMESLNRQVRLGIGRFKGYEDTVKGKSGGGGGGGGVAEELKLIQSLMEKINAKTIELKANAADGGSVYGPMETALRAARVEVERLGKDWDALVRSQGTTTDELLKQVRALDEQEAALERMRELTKGIAGGLSAAFANMSDAISKGGNVTEALAGGLDGVSSTLSDHLEASMAPAFDKIGKQISGTIASLNETQVGQVGLGDAAAMAGVGLATAASHALQGDMQAAGVALGSTAGRVIGTALGGAVGGAVGSAIGGYIAAQFGPGESEERTTRTGTFGAGTPYATGVSYDQRVERGAASVLAYKGAAEVFNNFGEKMTEFAETMVDLDPKMEAALDKMQGNSFQYIRILTGISDTTPNSSKSAEVQARTAKILEEAAASVWQIAEVIVTDGAKAITETQAAFRDFKANFDSETKEVLKLMGFTSEQISAAWSDFKGALIDGFRGGFLEELVAGGNATAEQAREYEAQQIAALHKRRDADLRTAREMGTSDDIVFQAYREREKVIRKATNDYLFAIKETTEVFSNTMAEQTAKVAALQSRVGAHGASPANVNLLFDARDRVMRMEADIAKSAADSAWERLYIDRKLTYDLEILAQERADALLAIEVEAMAAVVGLQGNLVSTIQSRIGARGATKGNQARLFEAQSAFMRMEADAAMLVADSAEERYLIQQKLKFDLEILAQNHADALLDIETSAAAERKALRLQELDDMRAANDNKQGSLGRNADLFGARMDLFPGSMKAVNRYFTAQSGLIDQKLQDDLVGVKEHTKKFAKIHEIARADQLRLEQDYQAAKLQVAQRGNDAEQAALTFREQFLQNQITLGKNTTANEKKLLNVRTALVTERYADELLEYEEGSRKYKRLVRLRDQEILILQKDFLDALERDAQARIDRQQSRLAAKQEREEDRLNSRRDDILNELRSRYEGLLGAQENLLAARDALAGGNLAPGDEMSQFRALQEQFGTATTSARRGDVGAASDLSRIASQLLQQGQVVYGSSTQYGSLYSMITSTLESVGAKFGDRAADLESTLTASDMRDISEKSTKRLLTGLAKLDDRLASIESNTGYQTPSSSTYLRSTTGSK